ncbi:hypothetical protein ACTMU2_21990 [Cupriavidus basilensis]
MPTLDEQGLKGFDATLQYFVVGPKGMPQDVVNKLNAAINTVQAKERYQAKYKALGGTTVPQGVLPGRNCATSARRRALYASGQGGQDHPAMSTNYFDRPMSRMYLSILTSALAPNAGSLLPRFLFRAGKHSSGPVRSGCTRRGKIVKIGVIGAGFIGPEPWRG